MYFPQRDHTLITNPEKSVENLVSGFARICYGYLCDLHGSRIQLSSARLAENQTDSLTKGTLLKIFRLDYLGMKACSNRFHLVQARC